jgi:hypothetical protein
MVDVEHFLETASGSIDPWFIIPPLDAYRVRRHKFTVWEFMVLVMALSVLCFKKLCYTSGQTETLT